MKKYICYLTVVFFAIIYIACDDANELLDQHIKNGPIVYAGKVKEVEVQSGYYRARINLFPADDVNRDYCILRWNITSETKDSVKVDYVPANFDEELECYYFIVSLPNIEGNLLIEAINVDKYGNRSLLATGSANIYGIDYISSLVNAPIDISPRVDNVTFEDRVGAVGNIIIYERNDGSFSPEIYVTDKEYPLVDAKRGGVIRTKTRYLINETDIDTLEVADFSETIIPNNEGIDAMLRLKETSPLVLDDKRLALLYELETYSDRINPSIFRDYRLGSDDVSIDMEHSVPILYCYRNAFDKILYELENTEVEYGTAAVWLLYNMGYIVKTPSGTYGVDIYHRWSEKLEPYLDFLAVTHNHGDHADLKLMDAMVAKGKPVLSNFYAKGGSFTSKVPSTYTIGNFTIKTDLTDHLRQTSLPDDFVTVFRIESGSDASNFSMLHCGDSGFRSSQYKNVEGPLDLAVLRWGAPRENDILGTGSGQVQTNYAVLSHLIELGHDQYPNGQASITQTLKHLPNVNCENTILPFWGEKMIWKNGGLL